MAVRALLAFPSPRLAMPSELEVAQQQLAEVRTAISAILTRGQSMGENGRELTRADLKGLREMETDLRSRVARLTRGGGMRVTRIVPR